MNKNILLRTTLCLLLTGAAALPCRAEDSENPIEPHVYLPLFGEHETSYNIYTETLHEFGTDSICYVEDKVIGDRIYKSFETKKAFFGGNFLIRATEDNSKVYCLDEYMGEEVLTFDLSLEKGDHFMYYHPKRVVDCTVDSVYTDAQGRKNLYLSSYDVYNTVYLKFIEGIGSSVGLFSSRCNYCQIIFRTFLLCSWKDGEASYHYYEDLSDMKEINKNYFDYWPRYLFDESSLCSISTLSTDDSSLSGDWSVYPNPFDETFYVEHNSELIRTVSVYDPAGKLILQKEVNGFNTEISIFAPSATYHVLVITETGKQYHKKIVKL